MCNYNFYIKFSLIAILLLTLIRFYFKILRDAVFIKKGGVKMKKVVLLVISFLLLLSFGCATQEYVKQQIDPLIDRISKLEARVAAIESRLSGLEGKIAGIDEAKKEAREAKTLAQEAMKTALDCCDKAEAAAKRAEAAADRAENAAKKCAKAFELQQKK
jgi:DNA repair exonuclease SbcCD ATPase subunit